MEFRIGGLNPKITGCNEAFRFFYRGNEMEMCNFWIVSKIFVGKLFARNEAFRRMKWECVDRVMKTDYIFGAGSKADLTSKMEMVMEFERFPTFLGNGRASGMGIGSFGVVSKTFVVKRFSRNAAFRGM